MSFPSIVNGKIVDEQGNLTAEWVQWFNQATTFIQSNYNAEGLVLPQQPTANIANLSDANKSIGAMLYDSTTNEFKVNINGTWKVVTVV